MEFAFTARSPDGSTRTGIQHAESVADVRKRLKDAGLFAVHVSADRAVVRGRLPFAGRERSPIRRTDILTLTAQLAIMSEAGVDFAESLQSVADQCRHPRLKRVLLAILEDISAGIAVSEALRRQADVFGEAYVASIAAGEASGTLPEVLKRLTDLLRKEIRLRTAIRGILAYPCVLTAVSTLAFAALLFFVLPQFAGVFESLGEAPPMHTQLLLDIGTFLRGHVLSISAGLLAAGFGLWRLGISDRLVTYWDGLILTSRLSGPAVQALQAGRAFRMLGLMLQSGIPLLESIRLCRASVHNRVFATLFSAMETSVLKGSGIGPVVSTTGFVPAGAAQMIGTAERTGRLGSVLVTVGEFYETEGEQQVRDVVKQLEPAIIVVMGVVVAGVVMAVILPLLEISTSTH